MSVIRMVSLIPILLAINSHCFSQECEITVSGFIYDYHHDEILEYSNILIEETGQGTVSDTSGAFVLKNICPGSYHFRISHIGCETKSIYLKVLRDTIIVFKLEHHAGTLPEVEIEGRSADESFTQVTSIVDDLQKQSNKTLAEITNDLPGVNTVKSGPGLAKPIIHGLYGNRIAIVNNGILQTGQQWGIDHAPEIDPFSASKITVLKGAAAIKYGGNNLGGAVVLEPSPIQKDPHLHGLAQYSFNSNGKINTLNLRTESSSKIFDWRITGTLKYGGYQKTPDYYLTNTGQLLQSASLLLNKSIGSRWTNTFYYSIFNTEIGILRGSHIGNITDLEDAIGSDVPFYTEDKFSYDISEPRQEVIHQLLKLESKYFVTEDQYINFTYGGQLNDRREFDVRRSGRSESAALDLDLLSHNFDLSFTSEKKGTNIIGVQYQYVENDNIPGTGILPLIPDYQLYTSSIYAIHKSTKSALPFEIGGRYDNVNMNVLFINKSREIEVFDITFNNFSFDLGTLLKKIEHLDVQINAGYVKRSPFVNELFSSGLHQGVSGIEEGDQDLVSENALKGLVNFLYHPADDISFELVGYHQNIENFIYLQPQEELRLTVRGAFPVFLYQQTDVEISGVDLGIRLNPNTNTEFTSSYSMIRARNISDSKDLVLMPADMLNAKLTLLTNKKGIFKEMEIDIGAKYVWEQTRVPQDEDFLNPPDAYFLLNMGIEKSFDLKTSELQMQLVVDNLLNEKYRDYLNRLRYFADDVGRDISVAVRYIF